MDYELRVRGLPTQIFVKKNSQSRGLFLKQKPIRIKNDVSAENGKQSRDEARLAANSGRYQKGHFSR